MLAVLRKMEQRGVLDKLKKTRQACRQIFTYAVITGRAENNPVVDLSSALKAPKQKHIPHLLTDQIGDFLRASEAKQTISIWQTELQLGIISDDDKASLTAWINHIKAVQAVDTSMAPDITWPVKPAT